MEAVQLDLLQRRLPRRPYCKDEKDAPQLIRSLNSALRRRYIQANPPSLRFWMLFDVDRPGAAMAWDDAELPEPAWASVTPENGHAHLAWGIEAPVLLSDPDRQKPLRYLTAIERAYAAKMEADPSFAGYITKNPRHPQWRTLWGDTMLRSLDELAEWVELDKFKLRGGKPEEVGLGRNCELFDWTRRWAYSAVRTYKAQGGRGVYVWWEKAVRDAALHRNGDFRMPLPEQEVGHVAKSIARWVWRNFSLEGFSAWQSRRGSKKGEERRKRLQPEAIRLADEGYSQRQIAIALGITQQTVSNWLRSC
ncbi:MAG: replication initiation protein [Halorhodospira sp.]